MKDKMKNKIKELLSKSENNDIITCLQEINELFLRDYQIKIGNEIIEPLQVEAYYYHPKLFRDSSVHKSQLQTNNFGKLYFHPGPSNRSGVDICLSDSEEYFLSLLLKTAYVFSRTNTSKKESFTQSELAAKFKDKYNNEIVLEPKSPVFHTQRVGLAEKCDYKDELLGAIIGIENKDIQFSFAERFGKEKL